jgi:hypothetical protein
MGNLFPTNPTQVRLVGSSRTICRHIHAAQRQSHLWCSSLSLDIRIQMPNHIVSAHFEQTSPHLLKPTVALVKKMINRVLTRLESNLQCTDKQKWRQAPFVNSEWSGCLVQFPSMQFNPSVHEVSLEQELLYFFFGLATLKSSWHTQVSLSQRAFFAQMFFDTGCRTYVRSLFPF